MKRRLIRLGEKVYDRDLMEAVRVTVPMLHYLFEEETGRPHRERLTEAYRHLMMERRMIDGDGTMLIHGHDLLQKCEAVVDCTRCRCYRTEGGIERCAIYGTIAAAGEWCRDWEERS